MVRKLVKLESESKKWGSKIKGEKKCVTMREKQRDNMNARVLRVEISDRISDLLTYHPKCLSRYRLILSHWFKRPDDV